MARKTTPRRQRYVVGFPEHRQVTVYGRLGYLPRNHNDHDALDFCDCMSLEEAREAVKTSRGMVIWELVRVEDAR